MHREMTSAKDINNDYVPWTFGDVVLIVFFVATIDAIFFTLRYYRITSNVYLQALIKLSIPLFWVWHYYPISFKKIGLQLNGYDRKVSICRLCIIGTAWGCILAIISFSVYGCTIGLVINSLSPKIAISLLMYSIVYLISVNGFLKIVLCPLGEEVLYRGIVFNWLNGRLGFIVAVGLTSIVYCFSHEDLFSYLSPVGSKPATGGHFKTSQCGLDNHPSLVDLQARSFNL